MRLNSNNKRRAAAILVATGLVSSNVLATPAQAQSNGCSASAQDVGKVKADIRANIWTSTSYTAAEILPSNKWRVKGFEKGKGLAELTLRSFDAGKDDLSFYLGSLVAEDAATLTGARVIWTVEGFRQRVPAAMQSSTAKGELPDNVKNFEALYKDITVELYLAGTPLDGKPDGTFRFKNSDIKAAHKLGDAEMAKLQQVRARGDCTPTEPPSCFMTQATVGTIGLPDDSWELAALRNHRDRWLAKRPEGEADIKRYYDSAPAIATALMDDPKHMTKVYLGGILPAAIASKLRLDPLAHRIYKRQMNKLEAFAAKV